MKTAVIDQVCALLSAKGFKASVEHPSYILLSFSFADLNIGMANGPWEIDVANGGDIRSAGASLPADSTADAVFAWVCDCAKKLQAEFNAQFTQS